MANMVRKQISIYPRQEALLKRLSKTRGMKEAEIIRAAIDLELSGAASQPAQPNHQAR